MKAANDFAHHRLLGNTACKEIGHYRKGILKAELEALRGSLKSDGVVWVSWPKKASKVPTDITEDTIRELALPLGFVDIKVCAVSEIWSALKLVIRKEPR